MWLILNNKMKPFDDVRVRQAINYLVPRADRGERPTTAWPRHGTPSPTSRPDTKTSSLTTSIRTRPKAPGEAGYADGFEADLLFSAGCRKWRTWRSSCKHRRQVGCQAKPEEASGRSVLRHRSSKKAQMALWIDSPIQPDVNYVVNLVYSAWPLALVSYDQFSDPAVDKLIETGASIVDPKARLEHHKGVQAKIKKAPRWDTRSSLISALVCRATSKAFTGTRRSITSCRKCRSSSSDVWRWRCLTDPPSVRHLPRRAASFWPSAAAAATNQEN